MKLVSSQKRPFTTQDIKTAFEDFSLFLSINKYLCAVRKNTVIHSYDMKVLCAVLCTFILFKVKKYSLKIIFAPTKYY